MDSKRAKETAILIDAFKRMVVWMVCTIGVLIAFGFLMEWLEMKVYDRILETTDGTPIVVMAAVGTPIHELSHMIVAKLFGFSIIDFELFRPIGFMMDGILGYVSYTYDQSSIIAQIGCFFVGIAPMIFGGFFILLIFRLVIPEVYHHADFMSDNTWKTSRDFRGFKSTCAFVKGFFEGIFKLKGLGILRAILALYLVCSIAMHMTISIIDFENGITGFLIMIVLFYLYGLIGALLKSPNYLMDAVEVASGLFMFFMLGVVCDSILLGITYLIDYIH